MSDDSLLILLFALAICAFMALGAAFSDWIEKKIEDRRKELLTPEQYRKLAAKKARGAVRAAMRRRKSDALKKFIKEW